LREGSLLSEYMYSDQVHRFQRNKAVRSLES
jgi:hypothetical protein